MRILVAKEEQFLTDAKGKRTGFVPDLEIGAGPFSTLDTYRAGAIRP
jgi:hypothetical protein